MKSCFLAMLLFVVIYGAVGQGINSLSANERKEGWKLLFNGKDTKGWHAYGAKEPGSAWKIEHSAWPCVKFNFPHQFLARADYSFEFVARAETSFMNVLFYYSLFSPAREIQSNFPHVRKLRLNFSHGRAECSIFRTARAEN